MRMYAAVRGRVGVCAGVVALVTALAVPTFGVPTLRAQQAPGADEVLYDMADSLGMLRTNAETDMFMAVEIWASGSMAEVRAGYDRPPRRGREPVRGDWLRLPGHAY